MIPFNRPPVAGGELAYIERAIAGNHKLSGDGPFNLACQEWLEKASGAHKALMTPSCTGALELAAMLLDIRPGDEVIMPSYTFVSTANAFVLRGAKIVFVDVRPDTMNLDESRIEAAITERTKAVVPVHYAGVGCDMDAIMTIAEKHGIRVVEDAAQAVMAFHHDRPLGSIGHLGCYSFHETKNYTAGGEGGALLINDPCYVDRSEILREKGTNRSQFYRGQVDKYTWRDIGSSFLPGELQAAYLLAQLEAAEQINERRLAIWERYHRAFASCESAGLASRPVVPDGCRHNAHMYYLILPSHAGRGRFIERMRERGIAALFHYVPLHSSPAGQRFGRFAGEDIFTTMMSERLVRLPLWFNMSDSDVERVIAGAVDTLNEIL